MLPDMLGTEVCRNIRAESNVPIIMLSARGEELDRIVGLELGADDYVTKPFSPREIAARVRTNLRRQHALANDRQPEPRYRIAELLVVPNAYEVYINSERIVMRPKEVEVLSYLTANAGKVVSREQILGAVWGYEYLGDTRVVDTQIKRIRQKLGSQDVHFAIRSVYGAGYKLEEAE
jgi:DNA-binding response OmpR family regulator